MNVVIIDLYVILMFHEVTLIHLLFYKCDNETKKAVNKMREFILIASLFVYALFGWAVMKSVDRYMEKNPMKQEDDQEELPQLDLKDSLQRYILHWYRHPRLSRLLFHLLNREQK